MKKILKELLKKYSILIGIELVLISINVYLLTVPSKALGQIIDLLYNIESNRKTIIRTLLYLLSMCVALLITRVTWRMLDAKISRDMVKRIRDVVFEKLLKIDVATLEKIKNGDIMSYFVKDIAEIRKFISLVITLTIRFVLNFVIVSLAMMQSTNAKMTLIAICPIVISIILILLMIYLMILRIKI